MAKSNKKVKQLLKEVFARLRVQARRWASAYAQMSKLGLKVIKDQDRAIDLLSRYGRDELLNNEEWEFVAHFLKTHDVKQN